FLKCPPAHVTLAPIKPGRQPDSESLREIFIRMTLRVPVFEMHHITAAERSRSVSVWRFLARSLPKELLPFLLPSKPIRVHISVTRFMSHQFHEPLRRLSLDLEHHRPLQRPQSVVNKEKRNKNCRYADWYKPLIADVTRRMKRESLCR